MKRNVAKEVFKAQIDEMYVKVTAAEEARDAAAAGSKREWARLITYTIFTWKVV